MEGAGRLVSYANVLEDAMLRHDSPTVDHILAHLCSKGLYGDVTEWCEMRHDCVIVVTCPDCGEMFTLDEDEYDALVRISRDEPRACGILPLA
jgi:hypothetical protein